MQDDAVTRKWYYRWVVGRRGGRLGSDLLGGGFCQWRGPDAGLRHPFEEALNLWGAPREGVGPEVVAGVLDELNKCHKQPPGVGPVDDQALKEHPCDLLLDHVHLRLRENEEQDAGEVVRVVVRIPQLVGHGVEEQEAALWAQRLGEEKEELHAGGHPRAH